MRGKNTNLLHGLTHCLIQWFSNKVHHTPYTSFLHCRTNLCSTLLKVKGKLASYTYEEASRAYGLYEDLQRIKDTLSIVRGLLLDAEEKKNQQHALREWLRQIRNICYDAEDVFDGFELQDKKKQVLETFGSNWMKVRHYLSSSNPLAFRFKMSHQIKEIKDRLDKVAADGTRFGLIIIDVEPRPTVQRREFTHSHVDALSVIGREDDKEAIIQLLGESNPQGDSDKSLCVIPIVGIGGLGKTTLAKLVFNDKRIDEVFQLKSWVCVSNGFDIRHIIIKMINSAYVSASTPPSVGCTVIAQQEDINHFDIEQLQISLRNKLSGQKFILVLDDIWNDDRAKWIELIDLIKVGAAESKIIVTTRINSIASMMGTVPSYVLGGLSPENCLTLFVKWAFKDGEEEQYPNLVEIGKEIVKKCAGVPLAVRTLGSSLFSKFDLNKWLFVRDHEIWNLEQKKDDILPALKLSYDEMPSYLRQCFAYFSLFPKDHTFNVFEMAFMWIGLGLVQSMNGSEKLEHIAREYIHELHSRSLLQDFNDFVYNSDFKMHDLIHDLALYVAKEEFVRVDSNTRNISEQARHLSIIENDSLEHVLFPMSTSVRTILLFSKGAGLDNEALLDTWVSRYKYLRYLDINVSSFETLPDSISKLKHLRILVLTNNRNIKRLPHSVSKLHNLQVLQFDGCTELEALPRGLGKMIGLQYLVITTKQSVLSLAEFVNLKHLQVLAFHCCKNMKLLFSRVQQFTSIVTLSLQSCWSLESLPLHLFPNLESLLISDCKILRTSFNSESPIHKLRLKNLYIGDFPGISTLPEWIEGAAQTIETLVIYELPNLLMLPECLTTMTHLKWLDIIGCPQLLNLPSDIHHLTALKELHIAGCPELCRKCKPQFGEYWPIIAHIKNVFIELIGEE
ncbi:disease resistance protein RGA2-like [Trifolium pratense]|uniref:disease resistance protein RGA2-like n=1 Tax=Trifolium pratense TaxID=57577 RepID=UPI001E6938B1|nr:disease resistance protein RGA2-like [Trifolium pratense]